MSCSFQLWLTVALSCFVSAAIAGSGERDFLGKRPGSSKDDEQWKSFLRSERDVDHGKAGDTQLMQDLSAAGLLEHTTSPAQGTFLDTTTEHVSGGSAEDAFQSCLKIHASAYLKPSIPAPVRIPGARYAAVAAAAVASFNIASKSEASLVKDRLAACLKTTQEDQTKIANSAPPAKVVIPPIVASPNAVPFSRFGGKTKSPAVKPVLIETDVSKACTKDLKKCKTDKHNCVHVLDILQFLRLQNIAVEKKIQANANQMNHNARALSLASVLQKHGLALPQPEDWDWTGANATHKMLIQSALEEGDLAVPDQKWGQLVSAPPPVGMMVHPLPEVHTRHNHFELPTNELAMPSNNELDLPPSSAMPVKFQNIRHHCSLQTQKDLAQCQKKLEACKVDVEDHNSILNKVAGPAIKENEVKLQSYVDR